MTPPRGCGLAARLLASAPLKIQAVIAADVKRLARKLFDTEKIVILALRGEGLRDGAGRRGSPGRSEGRHAAATIRLPLRDPSTLAPLP